ALVLAVKERYPDVDVAEALRAGAERTKEQIRDAAAHLFFSSNSYVTLTDIAKRAGVDITTVWSHFPGRDTLVDAVNERYPDREMSAPRRRQEETRAQILDAAAEVLLSNPKAPLT